MLDIVVVRSVAYRPSAFAFTRVRRSASVIKTWSEQFSFNSRSSAWRPGQTAGCAAERNRLLKAAEGRRHARGHA